MFTDNRVLHCKGVAEYMYNYVMKHTGNTDYAQEMYMLGFLHDIGYRFTDKIKDHGFIGGELLKKQGYKYWWEVYNHGNLEVTNMSPELLLLELADLSVGPKGEVMTVDERLANCGERFGILSHYYKVAEARIERIKKWMPELFE